MDIEIAKEILKGIDIKFFLYGMAEQSNYIVDKADEINIAIDTVLSELERLKKYENLEWQEFNELAVKDKIIDLMAKELSKLNYIQYCNANNCDYPHCNKEKCIKQYFTKKATDNVGE